MSSIVITFSILIINTLSSSTWDYDHMSEWPDDYPLCAAYDESPININTSIATIDNSICTSSFNWTIDYTKQTFQITNNAHTIKLQPVEISDIDGLSFSDIMARRRRMTEISEDDEDESNSTISTDDITYLVLNDNTIASFPNYFHPDGSDHYKYCLDSIHFHWGKSNDYGSEHTINAKHYPLEAHFVHYACDHAALETALSEYSDEDDVSEGVSNGEDVHVLGVVGIFFDVVENRTNPAFDAIFQEDTFEHIKYPDYDDEVDYAEIVYNLDLNELLPVNLATDGYYAYQGSLTTPPCTDIVRWFVMNARGYIGTQQMEKFRALMASTNETIAPNYRDIQSNPNDVYACIEDENDGNEENNDIEDEQIDAVNDGDDYKENLFKSIWKNNKMAVIFLIGGCIVLLIIGMAICAFRRMKGLNNNGMTRIAASDEEMDGVRDDNEMEIEIDDDNQQLIQ